MGLVGQLENLEYSAYHLAASIYRSVHNNSSTVFVLGPKRRHMEFLSEALGVISVEATTSAYARSKDRFKYHRTCEAPDLETLHEAVPRRGSLGVYRNCHVGDTKRSSPATDPAISSLPVTTRRDKTLNAVYIFSPTGVCTLSLVSNFGAVNYRRLIIVFSNQARPALHEIPQYGFSIHP